MGSIGRSARNTTESLTPLAVVGLSVAARALARLAGKFLYDALGVRVCVTCVSFWTHLVAFRKVAGYSLPASAFFAALATVLWDYVNVGSMVESVWEFEDAERAA